MELFKQHNLQNIKQIFEEKSGVSLPASPSFSHQKILVTAAVLICCLAMSGFAHSLFSSFQGDSLSLSPRYLGEGIIEIKIQNNSHKSLHFQEQIKLMQWSSAEEIPPLSDKISFSGTTFAPQSEGIMTIDLSQAYDIAALEQPLENDHYYLILTNNDFMFGQDWHCSVEFEEGDFPSMPEPTEKQEILSVLSEPQLKYSHWTWPTTSSDVSSAFSPRSQCVNIRGTIGDEVYAVADSVVLAADFDPSKGYFIRLDCGDGVEVEYGHLESILVDAGDILSAGELIGTLGNSGMTTGPNLSFYLFEQGISVNPLAE